MEKQVYVWDKFIRLFHWLLLILFCTSYLTGEEEHWLHPYSGYGIFTLVCLRIVWGITGSRYARFTDFVRSPKVVISYLKSIFSGSPKRYLGHNPAGGIMIVMLLASLLLTTLSGMKLYAIEEGKGPFAYITQMEAKTSIPAVAYDDSHHNEHDEISEHHQEHEEESEEEEFWEEVHEAAVNFMLLLIVLHVLGVFVASRQHGEKLIKSMFTGYKKV